MRYEAIVRAYDFFDLVQVVATVYETPNKVTERPQVVHQWAVVLSGTGEDDPHKWLTYGLRGLL